MKKLFKKKKLYQVDTISSFKMTYLVEAVSPEEAKTLVLHASTDDGLRETRYDPIQMYLGETISAVNLITKQKAQQVILNGDSYWMKLKDMILRAG